MEFHIYYHPIVADSNRLSSLSIALSHLEELTLSDRLPAAYVYKNIESL
jgi:hypothetical protein